MTAERAAADRAFCVAMLPKVSRTFALTIRLLPRSIEPAVLTAYLLCRVADTIEDSPSLDGEEKARLLEYFRTCLEVGGPDGGALGDAFGGVAGDEPLLAANADRVLREFRRLAEGEQRAIRPRVREMAAGMAGFAVRRGSTDGVQALQSVEELDRYCYYVAGTVGHLLTDLFRLSEPDITDTRYERLDALATSFGLGLQLTNIIKDVADDRHRGWSFVPRDLCSDAGLRPEDLQDPAHAAKARDVMWRLIAKARGHLDDALEYCVALPAGAYRVRIFCLTSLYFAVRTLGRAEHDPRLLDASHKVKITRGAVYRTVLTTHVVAPFNRLVRGYYRSLAAAG